MPEANFAMSLDMAQAIALLIVAVISGLLGWLVAHAKNQRKITRLTTTLNLERKASDERLAEIDKTFAALSGEALKSNNQVFLQLAQETLKQFHNQAKNELTQKEKAVENLVQPIREALATTARQIQDMEKERREAYGSLHKHLETMTQTQQLLHDETRNLVQALRRPEVRGQWGEMTLKRLAELSGMVEHCDFYEQESTRGEEGALRPDMVVRMPGGREVVVDVKTPLDAYLSAVETTDEAERSKHLQRHARKVRERVRELSNKTYWAQFKNAPDFIVLFIPGDQFLNAALDVDRRLLEDALSQKVILATPTSFVALLRAVAYGWRQESLAENAENIRAVGETLYNRLTTFAEHLSKLGKSLDSSVGHFNKAVGSFDANVLPGARRFADMGLRPKKDLVQPEQIEKAPREITKQTGKK